jgi:TfoX/Sxy family transcriptional regulator of competence genes
MAYDEKLADRIRDVLSRHGGLSERRMFGGIAFMLRGNMCCGVVGDDLMLRVGPEQYEKLLDFTGRPMRGLVYVGPDGYRSDEALAKWVERSVVFVASLPPK